MGLLSLFAVLWARKFLIAVAVCAAGGVAIGAGLVIPKHYESTAKVQVDALQQNLLTGLFEPRVRVSEFLGQQAAIASSRTVALKVIDTLSEQGVFVFDDFEAEWRRKTKGELVAGNDVRLWAADQLLEKLEINADALASTLSLTFRSEDSSQSTRFANAFANAYMETVLDQRQRRSARNAANFFDETKVLETDLEQAQRELSLFREQSGIVALGAQRLEGGEVQLASVTMRLAEARADYSEMRSLLRQAREASGAELLTLPLPDSATSGHQAQSRLASVLVQLQRLSERYGETYPDYVEAVNAKKTLEQTVLRAVVDRTEYAARRVEALEQTTAVQKVEVVKLQEMKQRYNVLENRVEASRNTYDLVANRSLQESLQSRVSYVEVLLLARAVLPEKSITPPLFVIVLIGLFAGAALGASAAVAIELIEGRIRSVSAVRHALRTTVIGEINLPKSKNVQRKMAA